MTSPVNVMCFAAGEPSVELHRFTNLVALAKSSFLLAFELAGKPLRVFPKSD